MIRHLIELFKYKKIKATEVEYTKEEASRIICPPSPGYLIEQDHLLAEVNMTYQNELEDMLWGMAQYILKLKNGANIDPRDESYAVDYAQDVMDALNKDVDNWWEAFNPHHKLARQYIFDAHAGDCNGLPCSCMRCHAEEWYKVPSTVTWKSKGEGYKIYKKTID